MSEPRTEAGRALLVTIREMHSGEWGGGFEGDAAVAEKGDYWRPDILAIEAEAAADAKPPEGTRLVLVADNLLDLIGTRTSSGNRLTFEWGEPDEHGVFSPIITEHADDNPITDARDREALTAARAARVTATVGRLREVMIVISTLLDELTEGCEPGPWHAHSWSDSDSDVWLDNLTGDSSWPTPNDVAVMLNALLAFRAALKEAQS